MVDPYSVLTVLVLLIGFYMAWNIGANDVSNAMGTSVGSGALTWKQAVFLAAILEFCGAYFLGANVSKTMERGVIKTDLFLDDPMILVLGMCGALLGTSFWLQLASFFKWPVSTTHAIVGAILGFGVFISGWEMLHWYEVIFIVISWIISPIISAIISYLIFIFLQKKILFAMNPVLATKRFLPFFSFIIFATFTLNFIFNGLQTLNLNPSFSQALMIAIGTGGIAAIVSYFIIRLTCLTESTINSEHPPNLKMEASLKISMKKLIKEKPASMERAPEYHFVEKIFVYLQIISACYIAFAHGANDVSNAIGPIAAVLDILKNGRVSETSPIPSWLLMLGGLGIVIGLASWGWRVIETVGKKITALTPTRGFCAEFGAATTILLASKIGLPVSTTHCLVGAVLGVGIARGMSALNLGMIQEIVLSWLMTIPASALMSILCFYILKIIFLPN